MPTRAEVASKYADDLGLHVFPVGSNGRSPLTEHGYKNAVGDGAGVAGLWRGREDANVAIATGILSGVFVLDVDCKPGQQGYESLKTLINGHGSLPLSWRAQTPSGGAHLFFRQPEGRPLKNKVAFMSGLDIKTTGGSVCAPPSARPFGEYAGDYTWIRDPFETLLCEAPEWLLEAIDPPPPPRPPQPPLRLSSTDRGARYIEAAIRSELARARAVAPNTGRNQQLFKSAASLGEMVGAELIPAGVVDAMLEDVAQENGLVRDDGMRSVRATIASGLRAGELKPREVRFD